MGDTTQSKNQSGFSSNRAWVWGIGGLFLMFFIANGAILILANTGSPSELIVQDPYEEGLRYDEALKEAEATKATGWRYRIVPCPDSKSLCAEFSASDGTALADVSGSVELVRPSDSKLDRKAALEPLDQAGLYRIPGPLAAGLWEVTLDLSRGEQHARWTHRMTYTP